MPRVVVLQAANNRWQLDTSRWWQLMGGGWSCFWRKQKHGQGVAAGC